MMTTLRTLWSILCFQVLIGKASPTETNTNNIRGGGGITDFNGDTQEFGGAKSSLGLVEDEEVEDPSEKESFPFLASLMDDGFNHICGGTLIARDMILTAASCEDRADLSYARLQGDAMEDSSILEILETFPNPEYNMLTGEQNTMLVQLQNQAEILSSDAIVQVMLNDAETGRPSRWPVSVLKDGEMLSAFSFLPSERTINDANSEINESEDEWSRWKLGYVGKETCQTKIEVSGEYQTNFNPEDSFCLDRKDDGVPLSCHQGEIGGPILWESDITGARLLLGVNTWGIGCQPLALPNVASMVNIGGEFIKEIVCAASSYQPSYMGCLGNSFGIEESQSLDNMELVFSPEFDSSFGGPAFINRPRNAVLERPEDAVIVFLLLLFDVTKARNVMWTIRDASDNLAVAKAPREKYISQNDSTELLKLIPGRTYMITIVDASRTRIRDYPRFRERNVTEFVITTSEPAVEIATGYIGAGEKQDFMFTVPTPTGVTVDVLQDFQDDNITSIDSEDDLTDFPSSSPTSDQSEAPSAPSCAPKGASCNSRLDCCSDRCSPQKICLSSINRKRERIRIDPSNFGGAGTSITRRSRAPPLDALFP